jgi:chromosome segregation ATPase
MTLEDIEKAEQISEAARIELESRVVQLNKELADQRLKSERMSEEIKSRDVRIGQLLKSEQVLKDSHRQEVLRLFKQMEASAGNNMTSSSGEEIKLEGDGIQTGSVNEVTLKFKIEELTKELKQKDELLESYSKVTEEKSANLRQQISDLTNHNEEVKAEVNIQRNRTVKLQEKIELLIAEASTLREKLSIIETEKQSWENKVSHLIFELDRSKGELNRIEMKNSTELVKLKEEIEKSFDEAAQAIADKQALQEDLETLQTSHSYLKKELEDKSKIIHDLQIKTKDLEQLLQQVEGLNKPTNRDDVQNLKTAIRELNSKLESELKLNHFLNTELQNMKQSVAFLTNSEKELREAFTDVRAEAQRLSAVLAEKEAILGQKEKELEEVVSENRQINEEYTKLQEEYSSTNNRASTVGQEKEGLALEARSAASRIQELQKTLTQKVEEAHQLNEKYNSAQLKLVTTNQEYSSLRQSTQREVQSLQTSIKSLNDHNKMLIEMKKDKEIELLRLKTETDKRINSIQIELKDYKMLCDTLEASAKAEGGARGDFAQMISAFRRKSDESRALALEMSQSEDVVKLRAQLNDRSSLVQRLQLQNEQQIKTMDRELKTIKAQFQQIDRAYRAALEAFQLKTAELVKQREEVVLMQQEKETLQNENRSIKSHLRHIMRESSDLKQEMSKLSKSNSHLSQCIAERDNRISDLCSDENDARDRLALEYKKKLEEAENTLKAKETLIQSLETQIKSLTEKLKETKQGYVPNASLDSIEREFVLGWYFDMLDAFKSMKYFEKEQISENNPEQVRKISKAILAATAEINVNYSLL